MTQTKEDVYCTVSGEDIKVACYLPGVCVLAHSLRDCGTTKKLAVLVTLDTLLYNTITELKNVFDFVVPVDKIATPNLENLFRLDRLDLRFAFTKIALWKQEQFRKIVYIDADVVAHRAPDELFDLDARFAAAPDIGWPDCFNSGVMLLSPNMGDFWALETSASSGSSFDGADQGLLNEYFGNRPWHRLSFTYNCTPSSSYQYEPAYRHFRSNISMTHFIGKDKPWQNGRQALSSGGSGVYRELLGSWWSVYDRHYKTLQSSAYGQVSANRTVQAWVKDEQSHSAIGSAGPVPVPAEAPVATTEQPMIGSTEAMKNAEEPRAPFQAPRMEWDATRSVPPAHSKPEAQAFPSRRYEMSQDPGLFKAPESYHSSEAPKAIFPWEQSERKHKPTRVFTTEQTQPNRTDPTETQKPSTQTEPIEGLSSPSLAAPARAYDTKAYDEFSRSNAWDNNSSIEQYVRAVKQSQGKKGNVEVLHNLSAADFAPGASQPTKRRESLILTDFPTEIERPSLPVTPAPIRRPNFWGEERNNAGDLPAAEGVPDQTEWDPMQKLEQLRKASITAAEELPEHSTRDVPMRDVPESSAPQQPALALEAQEGTPSSSPREEKVLKTGLSRSVSDLMSSIEQKASDMPEGTTEEPGVASSPSKAEK